MVAQKKKNGMKEQLEAWKIALELDALSLTTHIYLHMKTTGFCKLVRNDML